MNARTRAMALAMFVAGIGAAALAQQPADEIAFKRLDCALPSGRADPNPLRTGKWAFLSMCVGNRGYGYGSLVGDGQRRFGKVADSEFYGYVLDNRGLGPTVSYLDADGRRRFSFDGLGLLVDDKAIAGTQYGYLPVRGHALTYKLHVLSYFGPVSVPHRYVAMRHQPCAEAKASHPELDCRRDADAAWFFQFDLRDKPTLCRQPFDAQDCARSLDHAIEPLLAAIEAEARRAPAQIRSQDVKLRSAVLAITQHGMLAPLRQAQHDLDAAATQLERARMNAGQLFALQDELRAAGKVDDARAVLRLLVSRFPDDRIAESAARLLLARIEVAP